MFGKECSLLPQCREINAHTHSFASAPAAFRELATRRNRHVWETWIICRQFNQPAETNVFGMARRQSTSLGAALAYYTVFSLAPLVLLLLAIVGFLFRNDPAGAWQKVTEQMSYFLDKSAIDVVQGIAQKASQPNKGVVATSTGILLALFGASGVFGQLQDALNTIWGVKAKPGVGIMGFIRSRFLSFAMVAGVCFLLLVSLVLESLLKSLSHYVQAMLPGGIIIALVVYSIFDLAVVVLLFAC